MPALTTLAQRTDAIAITRGRAKECRPSAIASGGLDGGGGGGGLGGRLRSEAKDTDHRDGVSLFFLRARGRAGGREGYERGGILDHV